MVDLQNTDDENKKPEVEEGLSKELNASMVDGDADNSDEGGDDGEEGDDGKSGKSGGGGKKPGLEIQLQDLFLDLEDFSKYDKEGFIEKLKLLAWLPLSTVINGASAFDSESDLRRTLLIGEIGLKNHQIETKDLADPNLIAKLEKRLQERLAQFDAEKAAAGLAAGMLVNEMNAPEKKADDQVQAKMAEPKSDKVEQKIEQKADKKLPLDEKRKRDVLMAEKLVDAKGQATELKGEQSSSDLKGDQKQPEVKDDKLLTAAILIDAMMDLGIKSLAEQQDALANLKTPVFGPSDIDAITPLFKQASEKVAVAPALEQKIELKLPELAPKIDPNRMGGLG